MITTALAEKESQGVEYYLALSEDCKATRVS